MKKYLFLLILVLFALPGVASNSYCDSRPGAHAVQRCYQLQVEVKVGSFNKLMGKYQASPEVRKAVPDINQRIINIRNELSSQISACSNDACVYDIMNGAVNDLNKAYYKLGGK